MKLHISKLNERSFFHEFDGEEIKKGIFAHGKYDVVYQWEDNKVYSIEVCKMFQAVPNYILVNLDLPYRQNGIYQICEQDLIELRNRVVI